MIDRDYGGGGAGARGLARDGGYVRGAVPLMGSVERLSRLDLTAPAHLLVGVELSLYDDYDAASSLVDQIRSLEGAGRLSGLLITDRSDVGGSVITHAMFDAANRLLELAYVPYLHDRELTDDEQETMYYWIRRVTLEPADLVANRVALALARLRPRLFGRRVSGSWVLLRGLGSQLAERVQQSRKNSMRGYYGSDVMVGHHRHHHHHHRHYWRDYEPPVYPTDIPGYGPGYFGYPGYGYAGPDYGYGGGYAPSYPDYGYAQDYAYDRGSLGMPQEEFLALAPQGVTNVEAQVSGPWAEIKYGVHAHGAGGGAGLRGLSRGGTYERR